jgi:tetratricopeptide (TPR) repeat protein
MSRGNYIFNFLFVIARSKKEYLVATKQSRKKTASVLLMTMCMFFSMGMVRAQSIFTRVHLDAGTTSSCLAILDSCEKCGYQRDSVLFYRGLNEVKLGKISEARALEKQLKKSYPDFYELHYLSGLIYLAQKNYGKSVNEFKIVIEKDKKNLKALYNRATAFGLLEEYEKAIKDLDECIEVFPNYAHAHYSRAYWNEFLGNHTEAIKDYDLSISLDPKNYEAYLGLAYIYRSLKEKEKSCETINRAITAGSQIAEEVKENFCR